MAKTLVFIFALLLIHLAVAAEPGRNLTVARVADNRIALVIGNSQYPGATLKNPVNDAHDMAQALRRLGFAVIEKVDVTQKEMNRAISQFGEKLRTDSVAIFYYAGHGMQIKGKNYLIPVDAQIGSEASARAETVDIDTVMDQLAVSSLNIVILDACRNNPFERRFRSAGGGLAQMDAPKGTLIAYATAPGKTAADGDGRNGLYTRELLKLIQAPGVPIENVFKKVRANVALATGDNQIPWEASSLTGDFYFKPHAKTIASTATTAASTPSAEQVAVAAPDPASLDLAYWEGVKGSRDPEAFRTYLDQYPAGHFAALARIRLNELNAEAAGKSTAKPTRSRSTDCLNGTWEAQISGNQFQMLVRWNPATSQYEGLLARHGEGSHAVGFTIGETIWKARVTDASGRLHESQMLRHSAADARWLEGEIDLERCNASELVTSFARFRRVPNPE